MNVTKEIGHCERMASETTDKELAIMLHRRRARLMRNRSISPVDLVAEGKLESDIMPHLHEIGVFASYHTVRGWFWRQETSSIHINGHLLKRQCMAPGRYVYQLLKEVGDETT